jgi:hypothetical protein
LWKKARFGLTWINDGAMRVSTTVPMIGRPVPVIAACRWSR